jgi:hypothetical protein
MKNPIVEQFPGGKFRGVRPIDPHGRTVERSAAVWANMLVEYRKLAWQAAGLYRWLVGQVADETLAAFLQHASDAQKSATGQARELLLAQGVTAKVRSGLPGVSWPLQLRWRLAPGGVWRRARRDAETRRAYLQACVNEAERARLAGVQDALQALQQEENREIDYLAERIKEFTP